MSDASGTPLSELLAQWRARNVRVPAEVGAFVVLEVSEGLLEGPAVLGAGEVRVAEDGTVTLPASRAPASAEEAARAVTALLGSVLVAAGTVAPPALVRVAEAAPPTGASCLDRLRDDLEAALVPLNRQAARRVLARLVREARRVPARGTEPAGPVEQLDRELGPLVAPRTGPGQDDAADPVDALLADTADAQATLFEGAPSMLLPASEDPATIATSSPGSLEAPGETPSDEAPRSPSVRAAPVDRRDPERRAEPSGPRAERERFGEPPARDGTLRYVAAFVLVALVSGAALLVVRPALLARLVGEPPPPEAAGTEDGRVGTLTIAIGTPAAELLRFVGRAPVTLPPLASTSPSEIVAVLEGHAPARGVIGGGRGEGEDASIALTLDPLAPGADPLALGPPLRPGAMDAPRGDGRGRIVTDPAGAKVYLVVGRAPDVRLDGLPTEEVIELLVAAEGFETERLLVAPSDWTEGDDGTPRVDLRAALRPAE